MGAKSKTCVMIMLSCLTGPSNSSRTSVPGFRPQVLHHVYISQGSQPFSSTARSGSLGPPLL
eukprot:5772205-Alexandrium_andersonii.AAC.1